ncbi:hypothetical protein, partial [Streptomyces smaragdinus]|uniref:hypothetical protein n=1 Tax=Streptomyces smaragdinus TaxID=2585196 RepID=UPI0018865725
MASGSVPGLPGCACFGLWVGVIGYSVAREGGSPVSTAIGRGSVVFFSAMTLFIALLAVLVPA